MPELNIPYAQRQLARRQLTSGGGGGGSVSAANTGLRVPDVSNVYKGIGGLGEDLGDVGQAMARIAQQRQRARDTATITAIEASVEEQVAFKSQEIMRDASIHPFDYRTQLQGYRDQLLGSMDVPQRLRGLATAKVQSATTRYLIEADREGTKRGVQQAVDTYDLYADQQGRDWLNATSQDERDQVSERMRTKTREYLDAGILSPPQGAQKLRDWQDKTEFEALTLAAIAQPRQFLEAAERGQLNNLPGDMRVKLIDKAQTERREQAEWQDAEDRRAEKKVADIQAINSSRVRAEVYRLGGGPQAVSLVNREREAGRLSEADHASHLGFAINLQTSRASQAAAAASRAAANAQRQDIIQRKKDADDIGMLVTNYLQQKPGPDGQVVTAQSLGNMLAAGKFNGTVTGETARFVYQHETAVTSRENTQKQQAFGRVVSVAEQQFEQAGLMKSEKPEVNQIWGLYYQDLNSQVYQGGRDPDTVHDEIFPKYVSQALGLLGERQRLIIQNLPPAYQTTPEMGVAPPLMKLQQDLNEGLIPEERFRIFSRQLRELERYPSFLEAEQRRKTPQATAAPTAAQRQPGAMQRIKENIQAVPRDLGKLIPNLSSPEAK